MCLQCHESLYPDNDTLLIELNKYITYPQFSIWTTTSLSHILFTVSGLNGENCHDLGNEIVEMFYKWYLGKTNGLWQLFITCFPKNRVSPFPHSSKIREQINDANKFYNENKNRSRKEMVKLLQKKYNIPEEDDDSGMIIGNIRDMRRNGKTFTKKIYRKKMMTLV
jgi:hypothetical protein